MDEKNIIGKTVKNIERDKGTCTICFTDGTRIRFEAGYEEPLEIELISKSGARYTIQEGFWD
jgi:hypothetical protein